MAKTISISLAFSEILIEKGLQNIIQSNKSFSLFSLLHSQDEISSLFKSIEGPDILIIDVFSKEFNLDKILAYSSFSAKTKVLPLTDIVSKHDFTSVLKAGVQTFLLKSSSESEILDGIVKLSKGESFIAKGIKNVLMEDVVNNEQKLAYKATCDALNISEREIEIIKLIAEGCINKEIADKLFLSNHTINTHRKNIMQKLGINNTSGIVLFAVKEGIVSPNDFLFSSK